MKLNHCLVLFVAVITLVLTGCSRGVAKLGGSIAKTGSKTAGQAFVLKETLELGTKLPSKFENLTQTRVTPTADGSWDMHLPNGGRARLADLSSREDAAVNNQLLTIRSIDLPKSSKQLEQLPANIPVFIQSRGNKWYQYVRSNGETGFSSSLQYQNLRVSLSDELPLRTAIDNLERPLFSDNTRFIHLTDKQGKNLDSIRINSKLGIEAASKTSFLDDLKKIKHQTVALSGKIIERKLDGIEISKIKDIARENKINLIIIESASPQRTLSSSYLLNLDEFSPRVQGSNQVGDFFNMFTNSIRRNNDFVELKVNPDKRSYTAMLLKAERPNIRPKIHTKSDIDINEHMHYSYRLSVKSIETFFEIMIDEALEEEQRSQ